MANQNPDDILLPKPAALSRILDDTITPLAHRRLSATTEDVVEARAKPWWAIDRAGRQLLAEGVPVLWRRASLSLAGVRIYDAALYRAANRDTLRRFDELAARLAAEDTSTNHPVFEIATLPLLDPIGDLPTVVWPDAGGFVTLMRRLWWPGWSVRRALGGEVPGPEECSWSCRLRTRAGMTDLTLVASLP